MKKKNKPTPKASMCVVSCQMEHEQFETDNNAFKCIECDTRIKVESAEKRPRPISCPECGTEYTIMKNNKGGLSVTVQTESEPELVTESEEDLEEEYLDETEEEH